MSEIPTIAVSMIVRNEAETLPRLLPELVKFDRVVIVDTGSTDGTLELFAEWMEEHDNIDVHKFKWADNFAEARNEALKHVSDFDYFIWFDADDVIQPHFESCVRKLLKNNPTTELFYLPYWYTIEDDKPVMVHYRERIFKSPGKWTWINPLHEVCVKYPGFASPSVGTVPPESLIVEHRPLPNRHDDPDRNWNILTKAMLCVEPPNPETLYYLQRDCGCRGQNEFAIILGKVLLNTDVSGFMRYECHKHMADAYARIYKETKTPEYAELALHSYALGVEPNCNESLAGAIEFLMYLGRYSEALAMTDLLSENPPETINAVTISKYGSYIHAVRALIHLHFDNINMALDEHLKSIDYPIVNELSCQVEFSLHRLLDEKNIGIVFVEDATDEDYRWDANVFQTELVNHEVFDSVILSTNPLCVRMARTLYIHIGDNPAFFFMEEGNPRLEKYRFGKTFTDVPMWGYVGTASRASDSVIDFLTETVLGDNSVIEDVGALDSIEEVIANARTARTKYFVAGFTNSTPLPRTPHIYMQAGKCVGMAGLTSEINKFNARDDNLYFLDTQKIEFIEVYGVEQPAWDVQLNMVQSATDQTVGMIAAGMEPWDGTTPYKYGIGGSESSVVYLAEELAMQGFKVTVFCPVETPRVIGLVEYRPMTSFNAETASYAYFISSRLPGVLNRRIGTKKQVLWLHDLIETYQGLDEIVADKIAVVSNHEWEKAMDMFGMKKIHVRPMVMSNAIHRSSPPETPYEKIPNSFIWTSSPDRGLDAFLEVLTPMVADIYITYSWANMNIAYATNPKMFTKIAEQKYRARQTGAKLLGRLGIDELRGLMSLMDWWFYPSTFEETFCISAVEAVNAQCHILTHDTGAVIETLIKADPSRHAWNYTCIPEGPLSDSRKRFYRNELLKPRADFEPVEVDEKLDWKYVGNLWREFLVYDN